MPPGPKPFDPQPDRPTDDTDPERQNHDYDNDKAEHTEEYIPDDGSYTSTIIWAVLIVSAVILGVAVLIAIRKYRGNRQEKRETFDMQYNDDTEGSDNASDEEEAEQPVQSRQRKKSIKEESVQPLDYTESVDNERVQRALRLAVESRNN